MKKFSQNFHLVLLAAALFLAPAAKSAAQGCPMMGAKAASGQTAGADSCCAAHATGEGQAAACPMQAAGTDKAACDHATAGKEACEKCAAAKQTAQAEKAGCASCGGTMVAEGATDAPATGAGKPAVKADDYPLTTCPVAGGKLGAMGDPVKYTYQGREVRFCCKGCIARFEKEPAKYLKIMNDTIVAREKASYPLTTCVVAGGKLGAMGAPVEYVAKDNHLVRFCCKGCIARFEKDPAPYLKKLAEARKTAAKKGGATEFAPASGSLAIDPHSGHHH